MFAALADRGAPARGTVPDQPQPAAILSRLGGSHTVVHPVALAATFFTLGLITLPVTSTPIHCRPPLKGNARSETA